MIIYIDLKKETYIMSVEVENQNNPTLKGRFLNLEVRRVG